ncbi:MAG: hypothetical protein AB8G05_04500 [Oligoflexales bacterium]
MHQKHLFIMDPLDKLNFKLDSSLRMASELSRLGHQCYFSVPIDLSWNSIAGRPFVKAASMEFEDFEPASVDLNSKQAYPMDEFSGIHMRKEPPFDMNYMSITWLLDAVGQKTQVFNAPSALRSFNEKLGIMQFPEDIGPALASFDPAEILEFIKNSCNGDAIIKPLDLYGGRGIFRINLVEISEQQAFERLQEASQKGHQMRLTQPFNQLIYEGEVRVFTIGGKALAWSLKKPSPGEFMANTSSGATIHAYKPSEALSKKVERIASTLLTKGIPLLGFDIIGDLVSEINITSPRLLQAPEDDRNYYGFIASWLAQKCR